MVNDTRSLRELEAKYTKPLMPGQILEAFPVESKVLVPIKLAQLKWKMDIHFNLLEKLEQDKSDPEFSRFQILVEKIIYMSPKESEHFKNLKVMQRLMCKTTRGVTDADIQRAKEVDIWNLHTFRNKRGKSACCPFHDDQHASFAVRANKWICFAGCGKGDSIDFIMKINNIPFYKAVDYLNKNNA